MEVPLPESEDEGCCAGLENQLNHGSTSPRAQHASKLPSLG